jgi:hypothetical protein
MVIDLRDKMIIFRHESFHLWECQISGILNTINDDYIIFSKIGISMIGLGFGFDKRHLKDKDGKDVMLHSLESTNYLKVEPNNHIYFQNMIDSVVIGI